jgi:superoxide reductase
MTTSVAEPMVSEVIQTADWKKEKHVPIIECPDTFAKDQMTDVKVTLGKEISHPNTTEHHIRWIDLYFLPDDGSKFAFQIAHIEFTAHGESVKGPNQGPVYTHHAGATSMKTSVGGTLQALAFCNIHGLWQSTRKITVP